MGWLHGKEDHMGLPSRGGKHTCRHYNPAGMCAICRADEEARQKEYNTYRTESETERQASRVNSGIPLAESDLVEVCDLVCTDPMTDTYESRWVSVVDFLTENPSAIVVDGRVFYGPDFDFGLEGR